VDTASEVTNANNRRDAVQQSGHDKSTQECVGA